MKKILDKIKANAKQFDGLLPQSEVRNDGTFRLDRGGNWTDGFYIGVLNLAYLLSGDEEFRQLAKGYDDFFALRIQNTEAVNKKNDFLPLDHDVGMIFLDKRFTIPNYPSRLLTYMQAKLPVLACTDPNTDIGKHIVEGEFGWWCLSDDEDEVGTVIEQIENSELRIMRENAFKYLNTHFN